MSLPQHTTHWSAFYPVIHSGPTVDCERCEEERRTWVEGVNDERVDPGVDSVGDRGMPSGIHRIQP